ncbi:MAG: energy-coupling factor transporter transmembrane component T [Ruthenibacterium sp.]
MASKVMAYLPRKSIVHSLTGTTKLVTFFLFTLAAILTYDTRVLVCLSVLSVGSFLLSKIKVREVQFMLWFTFAFLVLNNVFIFLISPEKGVAIYGTRHVICHLFGNYYLTQEQLFYMLNSSLKYFVAVSMALLFISATNPSEFAASLASVGISYRIGYALAIALRYIPDIQRNYHSISQAQQARGVELGSKEPLWMRVKNAVNILLPLISSSVSRIDVISNAMELRGFGKHNKRTWYMHRKFAVRDYLTILLSAVILAASILITVTSGSRFFNPFL